MAKQGNIPRNRGAGWLMLFALPFAAVGMGMAGLLFWTEWQHRQTLRWQEVPCRIRTVSLDNGETRQVKARYEYTFAGRTYTGTRVGLHFGSDNIGSFHRRAYAELSRYRRTGKPLPCYVNPQRPGESILYRQPRWELMLFYTLFAEVFGAVGLGMLVGAVWLLVTRSAVERAWAGNPEQPWLAHPHWATGEIRSSGDWTAGCLAAALLVGGLSVPSTVAAWDEFRRSGQPITMLALIFPAIGLLFALGGLRNLVRRRKYGVSVFRMAEVPGVIGGKLAGVITTRRVEAPEGYVVRLSCTRRRTRRSGNKSETSDEIVWEDERQIARDLLGADPEQTAIPVLFAIPYDLPPVAVEDGDQKVFWRLEANAATPGVDYRSTFEIPVFKTPESRPDFELDERLIADYSTPRDPDHELRRAGVLFRSDAEGDRYVFGAGRNLGSAIALGLFALLWLGVVPVLVRLEAPVMFPIAWGAFGLLFASGAFFFGFFCSEVLVSPEGIRVQSRLLLWRGTRWIDAASIDAISSRQSMQAGSRIYHDVVARVRHGKTVVLGRNVPSTSAAAIARRIEDSLLGASGQSG